MSNNTTSSLGIGFTELLATIFIVLKLTKVITWSWWWLLSPLWIPIALLGTVFLIGAAGIVIMHLCGPRPPRS